MPRSWTPEQTAALEERNRTLLVSAAAGAGKTATLTERIIRTLTDPAGGGELSRMLIVTFTRAAAAELRERISAALASAIAEGGRTAHLSRQLLSLPAAKISTIDSFCLDLVRAHAGALGLSPSFRLADEAENRLLLSSMMKRLIEDCYDGAVEGIDPHNFTALVDCLMTAKGVSKADEILLSLYDRTRNYAKADTLLAEAASTLAAEAEHPPFATPWGAYVKARAERTLAPYPARLRELLPRVASDALIGKKYPALIESDLDNLAPILSALAGGDYTQVKAALDGVKKMRTPSVPGAGDYPPAQEVKDLHTALHADISSLSKSFFLYEESAWKPLLTDLSGKVEITHRLLSEYTARVKEEKRRRGILSFSDLSRYALELLYADGTQTPLAREMAREYDYIYVDEYQDVNEVQHLIFEALSHPRSRFMVGDVKQSIYGFRGAQPDIFASLRHAFPDIGTCGDSDFATLSLAANFRSDPAILSFVNLIFGRHMAGGLADTIGYVEEADRLNPKKEATGARVQVALFSDASYEVYDADDTADSGEEGADADTQEPLAGRAEERYVAAEIARLLADGKKADGSPMLPKDIAILTRNKAASDRFAEALGELGIKCECGARRSFFLNPEILLVLSLLNTIDNPRRDVYLAGLLLSPLYGFSMDELIAIRRASRGEGEAPSLYEALVAYAAAHPEYARATRFLSDLVRYRRLAEGRPVDALIWQLYRETGLLSIAGADGEGEGESRRANLLLLYDYARRFEASSYRGLYNFITYINGIIEEGQSIEEARAQSDREDTVRIMTIHQSKGLEFPVCFVSDCGHGFNLSDAHALALYDRRLGLAVKLRDESGYATLKNPIYNVLSAITVERAIEEELRVLYVALTRPKERLYMTATVKDASKLLQKAVPADRTLTVTETYACRTYADLLITAAGADASYDLLIDGTPFLPTEAGAATEETPPEREAEDGPTATPIDEEAVSAYRKTLEERFSFVYPDAHLSRIAGKYAVSQLHPAALSDTGVVEVQELPTAEREAEAPEEAPAKKTLPRFLGGTRNTAAEAGTATHLFLQFCDFARLGSEGAAAERERLVRERFLSPEDAAIVRIGEVESFTKTPLFAAFVEEGARLYRELRFHARFAAPAFVEDADQKALYEGETVLVQGVMDAVLVSASGELWLIDYKTDRLTVEEKRDRAMAEEKLRARHGLQLSYYAAACRDIFGRTPDRVLIYSLALGDAVELTPNLPDGV